MSPPLAVNSLTADLEAAQITPDFPVLKNSSPYKDVDYGPRSFKKETEESTSAYKHYLPTWNDVKYPALEPFVHDEPGLRADPSFPNLLPAASKGTWTVTDLTPQIGAVVTGVQLSKLTPAGKDELALLVAQKKVVAFRDQDFKDLPIKDAVEYGKHFGRLHIHPTSGHPEGYPEIHLVHRSAGDATALKSYLSTRTNTITWHSDVTYEQQPPGTTFLYLLDGPATGGDTLFANTAEAYRRLSPEFRKRLHGLKAVHSAVEQAQSAIARDGISRREPVLNIHPIIRTHPVTGEKGIFVNPQFTRSIVGLKTEESDLLLKFLYDHIALGQDFQARVKWEPGTVVVWENRLAVHSAIVDWTDGHRRHLGRITPQAERPTETPFEGGDK